MTHRIHPYEQIELAYHLFSNKLELVIGKFQIEDSSYLKQIRHDVARIHVKAIRFCYLSKPIKLESQEMKARGLLTDDGSYISLPGGGGENYGEILFRQLSPEFLFNDRGHVYLGSTFAATRTPSSHATVRKTGFTIVHPTQTINLAMLGIVDWNNDEKDEWLIACDVRPHLGSESRTYYVLVPPPLRKGEPLQATVAAVYECYGLACKLTVRDSRAIPRVGEGELPPTDVHDALPGMEGVTEPPKPDSTPRSGLQERSL